MNDFTSNDPSLETQWRSIILFGRNSATYKFAFARSLLELVDNERNIITLDELSEPFSRYIMEHLKKNNKQGSSNSSGFLDACRKRIRNEIDEAELLQVTKSKGFNNVVDAFQVVGNGLIPRPFYEKDYSGANKRLVLTDELLKLKELTQYENLDAEADGRWRLVETAWNMGVPTNILEVRYDENDEELFIQTDVMARENITSSRQALNGYQKGKCFYCCKDVSIVSGSEKLCHVDHFLPHRNKREHLSSSTPANINGVWNLVLACAKCNSGKSANIPHLDYLSRLNKRNEFYISSKHPLSETIQNQTGSKPENRISFLNIHYNIANITTSWRPLDSLPSQF
jgi:5-methylcytosine-specific restriction endonuclease McrA